MKIIRSSAGDTVVEVVLATAVIASAIGLAVAMSNRNLQTGIDASKRSQALALAQDQVERIKNAYNSASPVLESYKDETPYCILNDGTIKEASGCQAYNETDISLNVAYSSATKVFTVTSEWPAPAGNPPSTLKLYYKLPGD